ncbi:MAG: MMPL family transporter, partial [Planctomycetes bacterium]|nr:MMPL family transporter [Planctomycetota bacterium]
MERAIQFILRYRVLFIILIVLITGFFGYYARQSTTDNSIEMWLSKDDEALDYYYQFINTFGNEEFFIVVIENERHFSSSGIRNIDHLAKEFERLEGVKDVISLATLLKDKLSSPHFKDILKKRGKKSTIEVFKEETISDEMYVNSIISADGKITAIIATVAKGSPESRKKLVLETRSIIREWYYTESAVRMELSAGGKAAGLKLNNGPICIVDKDMGESPVGEQAPVYGAVTVLKRLFNNFVQKFSLVEREPLPNNVYLAGPTIVNAELDRMSQKDIKIFMPVMFAIAVFVLIILFRNFSGVLIPIVTISINSVWVIGLFTVFQNKMNMISGMLTPLVFIISLATSLHILNRFYIETALSEHTLLGHTHAGHTQAGHRQKNIVQTIKEIATPCFLTSATTAIGFLSFMVSD